MRLAPRPLRRFFRGLPLEIGVRGHSRSHDAKWSSDGNDATLDPISVSAICAVPALMPSIRVRSAPARSPQREPTRLVAPGPVCGDLFLEHVVDAQRRGEVEQVVLPPVTGEVLCDLVGGLATATIAMHRESGRIPFASDDGANDGHAGLPGEVGDGSVNLHVHLVQRLLHPLHAA
jgi:hypothetical protein